TTAPAFRVREEWGELFPELTAVQTEAWRAPWRAWAEGRGLSGEEADTCTLEASGDRLRVRVPAALLGRLRTGRGEPGKGEVWLRAGDGALRQAALLEVVGYENEPEP